MVRAYHSRISGRVILDETSVGTVEALSPAEARELANQLVEAAACAERTAGPMTGGQAVAAVTGGKPVAVPPIPDPRTTR